MEYLRKERAVGHDNIICRSKEGPSLRRTGILSTLQIHKNYEQQSRKNAQRKEVGEEGREGGRKEMMKEGRREGMERGSKDGSKQAGSRDGELNIICGV